MNEQHYDLAKWPYRLRQRDITLSLHLDIDPLGKDRPRFDRSGHAYTSQRTREYEDTLGWHFKSIVGGLPDEEHLFGVRVVFGKRNRHRIDVDNLLKAVCDAGTGVIWKDDAQVREITARLVLDSVQPGIDILVWIVPSEGERYCQHCMKILKHRPPSIASRQKYCSSACFSAAKRTTLTCTECGKLFTIPKSLVHIRVRGKIPRQFCSHSCSNKWWWRHQPAEVHQSRCQFCGKKVSRREYTRCFACALSQRRAAALNMDKGKEKTIIEVEG